MDRRAFTFLEILFTVVIISAGLIAIMNWVPVAIQTKIKTEHKTTAIFLAQEKIEDIKWSALANFNKNFNQAAPASWSVPYNDFWWTATDVVDLTWSIKTISVSTWHTLEPNNKITFDTKIARR